MKIMKNLFMSMLAFVFVACGGVEEGSVKKETFKDGDTIILNSIMDSQITLLRKNGGFVIQGDEDKILMIDIFGTFCKPCQEEAPELMNFQLKNSDDLVLIGLNHLEEVTDQYVLDNFASKYNAYYFIVNSKQNEKIVNTIVEDIAYNKALSVPFKVVLVNGEYQKLTDIYEDNPENKFYIGKVPIETIQKDIDRMKK